MQNDSVAVIHLTSNRHFYFCFYLLIYWCSDLTFVEVDSELYEPFKHFFLQVNAQRASFQAVRGTTHLKLSTSISQVRLMGSGQKNDRLLTHSSDGSSIDSTETDGVELPSDSSDMAEDATTVQALEGNEQGQTQSEKGAVIEALEGKKVDNNDAQPSSTSVENGSSRAQVYPSGDLVYKKKEGWESFVLQCRMLVALPWQRVKKGSVLTIKLSGEVG